jgi:hypothetical protein
VDEYVLSERSLAREIFEPVYVKKLVAEHQSGIDHSERLWMLLNFEIWQRQFIDGESINVSQNQTCKTLAVA